MKPSAEVRELLRHWIVKTSGKVSLDDLKDDTAILEQRILSSLQIMDLILFIEEHSGTGIDVEQLKPGVFRDVDTILRNFFTHSAAPGG